jgi:hypothetical protein
MEATVAGTLLGIAEVDLPVLTAEVAACNMHVPVFGAAMGTSHAQVLRNRYKRGTPTTDTETLTLTEAVTAPLQSLEAEACPHAHQVTHWAI